MGDDQLDEERRGIFPGWKYRAFQSGAEMLVQGWDEVVEREGWVFTRAGNVYAAARIVEPQFDENGRPVRYEETPGRIRLRTDDYYDWNEERTIFGTSRSDVMIIEAGREKDFGPFEAFQDAIMQNKLELWMARLAPILIYRGASEEAKTIELNLEQPHIVPELDGRQVGYSLPWTYRSPFMESQYRSGVIRAQFGGEELLLDFNRLERVEQ